MYDAPSRQARQQFVIARHTPVEVVRSQTGWVKVREPGGMLAWVEDSVGRRQWTVRFKDLVTGELLSDTLVNVASTLGERGSVSLWWRYTNAWSSSTAAMLSQGSQRPLIS